MPETHHTSHAPEVRTLFTWKAKERPFKKRRRQYYVLVAFIALCCIILALLFDEIGLMFAIMAVWFLSVVLALNEPSEVEHKITTQGIITEEHSYLFKEMYDFWFSEKDNHTTLQVRTVTFFPGVISMIIDKNDKEHIRDILVKYIPYREVVEETFMDRASNWVTHTFPLE